MNAVFSAPTSFLSLVSLRQVVRLACFAAASPAGEETGVVVEGAGVWDAAGWMAIIKTLRHKALAANAKRMADFLGTVC
jgi:hypothetical protein